MGIDCNACSASNPDGALFCMSCGSKLSATCVTCGAELPAGARFCGQCGSEIDTGARTEAAKSATSAAAKDEKQAGERKYVTVLFADVVGSTASMAGLDPEDARELIEPTITIIGQIVQDHGGTVCKTMGDGLMALFGAPLAQEDHANRACQAALDVLAQSTISYPIRIGLHCGEVVLIRSGSDANPDYDAIGDVVNLAARLEQNATPDSVVLSSEVLRAARDSLEVEPLGAISLKGFDQDVDAFRLTSIVQHDHRRDRWSRYAFVGRERELRSLRALLDDAAQGVGQLVSITGEAGTGKSRLAHEFMTFAANQDWQVVYETGAHATKVTADSTVSGILTQLFDVSLQADRAELLKGLKRHLGVDGDVASKLHKGVAWLLGTLEDPMNADDPSNAAMRKYATQVFRAVIEKSCLGQPLLIVVDNLRLLDSSSRSTLEFLLNSASGLRLVIMTLSRSSEHALHQSGPVEARHIRLDGLNNGDAQRLLSNLLGDDPSLSELRDSVLKKSNNNPFYIEEIVTSLVEQGTLEGPIGQRVRAGDLTIDQIPASIFTMVGARIDRLPSDQRRVLQCLAVLNEATGIPELAALAQQTTGNVQLNIEALQQAGFVAPEDFLAAPGIALSHNIVRDVTYRALLRKERGQLHAGAYALLNKTANGEAPHQHQASIGHHAFEAGLFETAARHLTEAGRAAYRRSAHVEAADLMQRALRAFAQCRDTNGELTAEVDAHLELRNALFALGRLSEVEPILTSAANLSEQIGDRQRSSAVHTLLIHHHLSVGNQSAALESADKALSLAEHVQDVGSILNARFYKTQIYASLGRYLEASQEADWVLGAAQNGPNLQPDQKRTVVGLTGMWRIWCAAELGHFDEVTAHVMQAQEVMSGTGGAEHSSVDMIWAGLGCGLFWLRRGFLDAECFVLAADTLKQTLSVARSRKVDSWIAATASPLSLTLTLTGDPEGAVKLAQEAVERSPVREGAGNALRWTHLGRAELSLGRLADAEQHCELGLELAKRSGEAGHEAYALHALALLSQATGDVTRTKERIAAAIELAESLNMSPLRAACKNDFPTLV